MDLDSAREKSKQAFKSLIDLEKAHVVMKKTAIETMQHPNIHTYVYRTAVGLSSVQAITI